MLGINKKITKMLLTLGIKPILPEILDDLRAGEWDFMDIDVTTKLGTFGQRCGCKPNKVIVFDNFGAINGFSFAGVTLDEEMVNSHFMGLLVYIDEENLKVKVKSSVGVIDLEYKIEAIDKLDRNQTLKQIEQKFQNSAFLLGDGNDKAD